MSVPNSIIKQLAKTEISFEEIELPENMNIQAAANFLKGDSSKLLRVVALKSAKRTILAVLPYQSFLDIRVIFEQDDSELEFIEADRVVNLFSGCSETSFPPVPGVFKFDLIVDSSVLDLPEVIIESGNPAVLLKFDKINSNLLYQEAETSNFSTSKQRFYAGRTDEAAGERDVSFTATRLKQRVDETFDLPAMPEIAQDIMKLRVDPSADATKLAIVVRRDPSLAAQVISWASSPYYGYQGKVDSVETAIARVLGFELVMNLALGISIGKSLKVPMEGPLGVREFWKQAIYSASLAEKICRAMPVKQRPERGLIYLSGLLHNFGHLLLGHIFPPQFKLVNDAIQANPNIAVEDIEFYVLGVTHEEIGAWLMQNWHMPDELIVAVHRHHQEEFWSKHAVYSNIVLVTNRMLKRLNIGDSVDTEIPQSTLELLSLNETILENALQDIQSEAETLDIMAKQLVA